MSFGAKLNRWVGGRFENDTCCALCGEPGSVAVIKTPVAPSLEICMNCLHCAVTAIYRATVEALPKWKRVPTTAMKMSGFVGSVGE